MKVTSTEPSALVVDTDNQSIVSKGMNSNPQVQVRAPSSSWLYKPSEQLKPPTMGVMGHDHLSEGVIDAELISFSLPEGHSTHMFISQKVQRNTPTKGVKRQSSILICQEEGLGFDLNLRDDEIDQILKLDEERLAKLTDTEEMSLHVSPLSFYQRLDGWCHNIRQRHGKRICDKYYYHKDSNNMIFRSKAEVKRFICEGIYPTKPQSKKSKKTPESSLVSQPPKCGSSEEISLIGEKIDQDLNNIANMQKENEKKIENEQKGANVDDRN